MTAARSAEVGLADKVAFLGEPTAYPYACGPVQRHETHMSFVFLAGELVYKLKKPVLFPYLDFASLARREQACRAELMLNRRLAPDVYEDVIALTAGPGGLALGGTGTTVDWLVVMRRLDQAATLEAALLSGGIASPQLDRLIRRLVAFYRTALRVFIAADAHLVEWSRRLADNRRILTEPRLRLPVGLVRRIDTAQRRFLGERGDLIRERVLRRKIVDGHGDLRPEHIYLGDPPKIVDCLEFNAGLRAVDPLDEVAFLSLECERLGSPWAARYIEDRMLQTLHEGPAGLLFAFYRCHRAALRARLAIAHLLEPNPRTPEKWPALARTYLRLAATDAARLERALR